MSALHRQADQALLRELTARNARRPTDRDAGPVVASPGQLRAVEALLAARGTLDIPVVEAGSVRIDGAERRVRVVAATDITADPAVRHGEMSTMFYLRDHVQVASALMELFLRDPVRHATEGDTARALILSALHLMSTPAQLARFAAVIAHGDTGQEEWPHISLWFDDLAGEKPNGWRNKQDSFQMLAFLVLDAIDRGFLATDELLGAHRQFLRSVVPFLRAVGFPRYESSGSWEEITARRTSVTAVETALLARINDLTADGRTDFLADGPDFTARVAAMIEAGLREVGRRIPFESPDYTPGSVRHRRADAAVAYVLMYGLPELLARHAIPVGDPARPMTAREIEAVVLDELRTLDDPATGGMLRYTGDSYQRVNFHTYEVRETIRAIKSRVAADAEVHGGEIDLDRKQEMRDRLTPRGREAAWLHPLGHLATWAALRSLHTRRTDPEQARQYREFAMRQLNRMLGGVTGDDAWHAVLHEDGDYHVRRVPPHRVPECLVTYRDDRGRELIVPSPHTPLNWGAATLRSAVGLLAADDDMWLR
ncbi:hypothetical protein LO772_01225 [Yinghuangia sp. ASG 101]|uniref:hypothetical protein n=1 Tax=Yinghuangia sp. ASG 101 TaxID=2896848 RepID=UPI001E32003D|nr:hypothetical protein [Yinghuangia sp. ASG 101]UGQ12264.1 hypothetical protein LO772_01225 [Yinghuangia sp. ASG 101]